MVQRAQRSRGWCRLGSRPSHRRPRGATPAAPVGVLLLLACALVTPLTMALVSEEKHSLVASVGSYLMAAISGAMCLLTLISGTKLAVKLNGNFDGSKGSRKGSSNKSHSKGSSSGMMARRINVSAKVWALSFLCQVRYTRMPPCLLCSHFFAPFGALELTELSFRLLARQLCTLCLWVERSPRATPLAPLSSLSSISPTSRPLLFCW